MPKATIPNILQRGWTESQFGSQPTFAQAGGLVDTELGRASRWAEERVGATAYAAASAGTRQHDLLVLAEVAFVSSQLWRTRAVTLDGSAAMSRQESGYLTVRECHTNANSAMDEAERHIEDALQLIGSATLSNNGSVLVGKIVETGPFPVVTA